jgi:hypothetical protein
MTVVEDPDQSERHSHAGTHAPDNQRHSIVEAGMP